MSQEIQQITEKFEGTEETRNGEIRVFKDEIKNLINSAGKRRLSQRVCDRNLGECALARCPLSSLFKPLIRKCYRSTTRSLFCQN